MTKLKITNEKEFQATIKRIEGGFRSDVHKDLSKIQDTEATEDHTNLGSGCKSDENETQF